MIKVGDRFKSNKGSECVVVEYKNYSNVTIEFCDKYRYRLTMRGCTIEKGQFKNPYAPLLFGVGYVGVGKHRTKDGPASKGFASLPAYSTWTNMLSRCYDVNYTDRHLYKDSSVCEEWHNFQVFAEWYTKELIFVGWQDRTCLDKDVIGNGLVYSPYNCCLIPTAINRGVASIKGGKYLPGVTKSTNGYYGVIP